MQSKESMLPKGDEDFSIFPPGFKPDLKKLVEAGRRMDEEEEEERKGANLIKAKTPEGRDVVLDLEKERVRWQEFYKDHNLDLKGDIPEMKLTKEEAKEVQTLIEKGYIDSVAIIAEHLSYADIEREMTKGYVATELSENFKKDGGFSKLDKQETAEKPSYRLVFYKKVKELTDDAILNETLNVSPDNMETHLAKLKTEEGITH